MNKYPKTLRLKKLHNIKYGVYEKIDGSNISFQFNPWSLAKTKIKGKLRFDVYKWCSRTQKINFEKEPDGIFAKSKELLDKIEPKLKKLISYLIKELDDDNASVVMYGELFGSKIINRIDYGVEKNIKFYDILIDNAYFLGEDHKKKLFKKFDIPYMPLLGIVSIIEFSKPYYYQKWWRKTEKDFTKKANLKKVEGIIYKPLKSRAKKEPIYKDIFVEVKDIKGKKTIK